MNSNSSSSSSSSISSSSSSTYEANLSLAAELADTTAWYQKRVSGRPSDLNGPEPFIITLSQYHALEMSSRPSSPSPFPLISPPPSPSPSSSFQACDCLECYERELMDSRMSSTDSVCTDLLDEQPSFPFLRLPGEIRNRIYTEYFRAQRIRTCFITSSITRGNHMIGCSVKAKYYPGQNRVAYNHMHYSCSGHFLRRVCRQIHTETHLMLFQHATFWGFPEGFLAGIPGPLSSVQTALISRVEIAFEYRDIVDMEGNFDATVSTLGLAVAQVSAKLPGLKTLQLVFRGPRLDDEAWWEAVDALHTLVETAWQWHTPTCANNVAVRLRDEGYAMAKQVPFEPTVFTGVGSDVDEYDYWESEYSDDDEDEAFEEARRMVPADEDAEDDSRFEEDFMAYCSEDDLVYYSE
ncbi:hypothetical protein IQ07DRAFT_627983 [Pyrenochaeta sp. DS3sAY3a]|nr:hypothetical protein IQ07DRAFT_627983 [Pyrenochaeta sp. DS3sAY3a]